VFRLRCAIRRNDANTAPRYRQQPIASKRIHAIQKSRSSPQKFHVETSTKLVIRPLLALLALYKRWISPMLGTRCRFQPSCSDYARISIARFGATRGSLLAAWRLARCQPFARAGHDPVPEQFPGLWRRDARHSSAGCACNCVDPTAHCEAEATAESKEKHHD